jgi:hypothetical protein
MRLQKLTVLLGLTTALSCQTDASKDFSERHKTETYAFLNFFVNSTDSINYRDVIYFLDHDKDYDPPSDTIKTYFVNQMTAGDSIFNSDDKEFLLTQTNSMSKFYLEQERLPNKKIISAEKIGFDNSNDHEILWNKLKTICKCEQIASVSLPILSKDYKTAFVSIQYYTEFNGGGVSILYKKINGQWKYIDQLAFWDN